jgi:hypothetical protein
MLFTLLYRGSLPAAGSGGTRAVEKHQIRKQLSAQLSELWKTEPLLVKTGSHGLPLMQWTGHRAEPDPSVDPSYSMHHYFDMAGYHVVPLITRRNQLACRLNIKFLRRGQVGELIRSSGDLDNRLKVLFDALRMPHTTAELAGETGAGGERLHCLLEDDSLITGFSVETGRLLLPDNGRERGDYVELVIDVETVRLTALVGNMAY